MVGNVQRVSVLVLTSGFAVDSLPGGVGQFAIELARALDRTQFEPILGGLWRHHTPGEEQWLARLQQEGIHAFLAADWEETHPYHSFLRACRGILRHLSRQKVQLIHSHSQFADGLALLLARPLHAQAILRTVHNEREWPRRPLRRLFLANLIFPLVLPLEIGISQQVTDNLNQRPVARLLGRKSICIYNALDLDRFDTSPDAGIREVLRTELGLPLEAPVCITVGRLAPQKGYPILLEAAALVLAEIPSAHFLVVGGGELEPELKEMAKQLGIDRSVHFVGIRPDVENLLAAADLFVSSSQWEGLPTVILESMAAHIPVVATDVSGTREIVQDGVTGLLVPPQDPPALAQAIATMIRDQNRATKMGERAYHRVHEFSITKVAAQHMEVYRHLLNPA